MAVEVTGATKVGTQEKTEDLVLGSAASTSSELAPTASAAAEQAEVQAAVVLAKRFPRNEDEAFARLIKSCQRSSFADGAEYRFPRGGSQISGPSVKLAREAARLWGNIRYGVYVVRDDEATRQIRAWAWDMETNTRTEGEDSFKKLIYRKKGGWIAPDERDLRELTNRRAAILVRNCLLQLMPPDLIEDAAREAKVTIAKGVATDPGAERKRLIVAFGQLNINPKMLEEYLGHTLDQCSPAELVDLRGIYASIRDGNSKWNEYVVSAEAVEKSQKLNDAVRKSSTKATKSTSEAAGGEVGAEPGSGDAKTKSTPPAASGGDSEPIHEGDPDDTPLTEADKEAIKAAERAEHEAAQKGKEEGFEQQAQEVLAEVERTAQDTSEREPGED